MQWAGVSLARSPYQVSCQEGDIYPRGVLRNGSPDGEQGDEEMKKNQMELDKVVVENG